MIRCKKRINALLTIFVYYKEASITKCNKMAISGIIIVLVVALSSASAASNKGKKRKTISLEINSRVFTATPPKENILFPPPSVAAVVVVVVGRCLEIYRFFEQWKFHELVFGGSNQFSFGWFLLRVCEPVSGSRHYAKNLKILV